MSALELNFENVAEVKTQSQIRKLLIDACKSSYKVNVFTVTDSPIWVLNDRCEITFSSEVDAFKFATYCHIWKPRVETVNNGYRVGININTRF
jgi:hypothetical protein